MVATRIARDARISPKCVCDSVNNLHPDISNIVEAIAQMKRNNRALEMRVARNDAVRMLGFRV